MSNIKLYLGANYLHINIKKSKYIHFLTPRSKINVNSDLQVQFGSKDLKKVKEIKFLGVIIDDKLQWSSHIKYLAKKVSKTTGCLYAI